MADGSTMLYAGDDDGEETQPITNSFAFNLFAIDPEAQKSLKFDEDLCRKWRQINLQLMSVRVIPSSCAVAVNATRSWPSDKREKQKTSWGNKSKNKIERDEIASSQVTLVHCTMLIINSINYTPGDKMRVSEILPNICWNEESVECVCSQVIHRLPGLSGGWLSPQE